MTEKKPTIQMIKMLDGRIRFVSDYMTPDDATVFYLHLTEKLNFDVVRSHQEEVKPHEMEDELKEFFYGKDKEPKALPKKSKITKTKLGASPGPKKK